MIHQPRVQIHYCTQCRWLLRAAWYAQELLTTFETELGEVALVPGTGGIFAVYVDAAPDLVARRAGALPRYQGAEAAGARSGCARAQSRPYRSAATEGALSAAIETMATPSRYLRNIIVIIAPTRGTNIAFIV